MEYGFSVDMEMGWGLRVDTPKANSQDLDFDHDQLGSMQAYMSTSLYSTHARICMCLGLAMINFVYLLCMFQHLCAAAWTRPGDPRPRPCN